MHDDERPPNSDDSLLAHIRVVSALVVLVLFAWAVVVGRDISTLGLLSGSLAVLLGIYGIEAIRRNGDDR